jgi:hypothetical protein
VGDLVADEYVFGQPERISREAPVLILRYLSREIRLGGAANACHNLHTLGAKALPLGVVGEDPAGEAIRRSLAERGVPVDDVIPVLERPTPVKTRILGGGWGSRSARQQIVRVDREPDGAIAPATEALLVPVLLAAGALSLSWNGLSFTAAAELGGETRAGAALGFQQTSLGVASAVTPVAFAVIVVLLGIYLARVPAYDAEDFVALQKSSFAPFLKDLAFRWHAAEVMLDFILIAVCYYLAYRFRFEGEGFDNFLPYFTASLPVVLGCKLAALYGSGLYQRSWETFGLRDLAAVVRAVGMGSLFAVLTVTYLYRLEGFSRVVFLLDALLLGIAIVATRASFRTMSLAAAVRNKRSRRVLVYGAGQFGQTLVREMRANARWNMNPIAFIDDDPGKVRRWIMGVQVRGTLDELEATMRRYSVDEVVLSSPSINGKVEHRIREICTRMERPVRRLRMELRDLDA